MNSLSKRYTLESKMHQSHNDMIQAVLAIKDSHGTLNQINTDSEIHNIYNFNFELLELIDELESRQEDSLEFRQELCKTVGQLIGNPDLTVDEFEPVYKIMRTKLKQTHDKLEPTISYTNTHISESVETIKNAEFTINERFTHIPQTLIELKEVEENWDTMETQIKEDVSQIYHVKEQLKFGGNPLDAKQKKMDNSGLNTLIKIDQISIQQKNTDEYFETSYNQLNKYKQKLINLSLNNNFKQKKFFENPKYKTELELNAEGASIKTNIFNHTELVFNNNDPIYQNFNSENEVVEDPDDLLNESLSPVEKEKETFLVQVNHLGEPTINNKPIYVEKYNIIKKVPSISALNPSDKIITDVVSYMQNKTLSAPSSPTLNVNKKIKILKSIDSVLPVPVAQFGLPSLAHYAISHNPFAFLATIALLNRINKNHDAQNIPTLDLPKSPTPTYSYNKAIKFENLNLQSDSLEDLYKNKNIQLNLKINTPQLNLKGFNCSMSNDKFKNLDNKSLANKFFKKFKAYARFMDNNQIKGISFQDYKSNIAEKLNSKKLDNSFTSEELDLLETIIPNKLRTLLDEVEHQITHNNKSIVYPGYRSISNNDDHFNMFLDSTNSNDLVNYEKIPLYIEHPIPNLSEGFRNSIYFKEETEGIAQNLEILEESNYQSNISKLKFDTIKIFAANESILYQIKQNFILSETNQTFNFNFAHQLHKRQLQINKETIFNHQIFLKKNLYLGRGDLSSNEYSKFLKEYNYIFNRSQIIQKLDLGYTNEMQDIFSEVNLTSLKDTITEYNQSTFKILQLPNVPLDDSKQTSLDVKTDILTNLNYTNIINQTMFDLDSNNEMLTFNINQFNRQQPRLPFLEKCNNWIASTSLVEDYDTRLGLYNSVIEELEHRNMEQPLTIEEELEYYILRQRYWSEIHFSSLAETTKEDEARSQFTLYSMSEALVPDLITFCLIELKNMTNHIHIQDLLDKKQIIQNILNRKLVDTKLSPLEKLILQTINKCEFMPLQYDKVEDPVNDPEIFEDEEEFKRYMEFRKTLYHLFSKEYLYKKDTGLPTKKLKFESLLDEKINSDFGSMAAPAIEPKSEYSSKPYGTQIKTSSVQTTLKSDLTDLVKPKYRSLDTLEMVILMLSPKNTPKEVNATLRTLSRFMKVYKPFIQLRIMDLEPQLVDLCEKDSVILPLYKADQFSRLQSLEGLVPDTELAELNKEWELLTEIDDRLIMDQLKFVSQELKELENLRDAFKFFIDYYRTAVEPWFTSKVRLELEKKHKSLIKEQKVLEDITKFKGELLDKIRTYMVDLSPGKRSTSEVRTLLGKDELRQAFTKLDNAINVAKKKIEMLTHQLESFKSLMKTETQGSIFIFLRKKQEILDTWDRINVLKQLRQGNSATMDYSRYILSIFDKKLVYIVEKCKANNPSRPRWEKLDFELANSFIKDTTFTHLAKLVEIFEAANLTHKWKDVYVENVKDIINLNVFNGFQFKFTLFSNDLNLDQLKTSLKADAENIDKEKVNLRFRGKFLVGDLRFQYSDLFKRFVQPGPGMDKAFLDAQTDIPTIKAFAQFIIKAQSQVEQCLSLVEKELTTCKDLHNVRSTEVRYPGQIKLNSDFELYVHSQLKVFVHPLVNEFYQQVYLKYKDHFEHIVRKCLMADFTGNLEGYENVIHMMVGQIAMTLSTLVNDENGEALRARIFGSGFSSSLYTVANAVGIRLDPEILMAIIRNELLIIHRLNEFSWAQFCLEFVHNSLVNLELFCQHKLLALNESQVLADSINSLDETFLKEFVINFNKEIEVKISDFLLKLMFEAYNEHTAITSFTSYINAIESILNIGLTAIFDRFKNEGIDITGFSPIILNNLFVKCIKMIFESISQNFEKTLKSESIYLDRLTVEEQSDNIDISSKLSGLILLEQTKAFNRFETAVKPLITYTQYFTKYVTQQDYELPYLSKISRRVEPTFSPEFNFNFQKEYKALEKSGKLETHKGVLNKMSDMQEILRIEKEINQPVSEDNKVMSITKTLINILGDLVEEGTVSSRALVNTKINSIVANFLKEYKDAPNLNIEDHSMFILYYLDNVIRSKDDKLTDEQKAHYKNTMVVEEATDNTVEETTNNDSEQQKKKINLTPYYKQNVINTVEGTTDNTVEGTTDNTVEKTTDNTVEKTTDNTISEPTRIYKLQNKGMSPVLLKETNSTPSKGISTVFLAPDVGPTAYSRRRAAGHLINPVSKKISTATHPSSFKDTSFVVSEKDTDPTPSTNTPMISKDTPTIVLEKDTSIRVTSPTHSKGPIVSKKAIMGASQKVSNPNPPKDKPVRSLTPDEYNKILKNVLKEVRLDSSHETEQNIPKTILLDRLMQDEIVYMDLKHLGDLNKDPSDILKYFNINLKKCNKLVEPFISKDTDQELLSRKIQENFKKFNMTTKGVNFWTKAIIEFKNESDCSVPNIYCLDKYELLKFIQKLNSNDSSIVYGPNKDVIKKMINSIYKKPDGNFSKTDLFFPKDTSLDQQILKEIEKLRIKSLIDFNKVSRLSNVTKTILVERFKDINKLWNLELDLEFRVDLVHEIMDHSKFLFDFEEELVVQYYLKILVEQLNDVRINFDLVDSDILPNYEYFKSTEDPGPGRLKPKIQNDENRILNIYEFEKSLKTLDSSKVSNQIKLCLENITKPNYDSNISERIYNVRWFNDSERVTNPRLAPSTSNITDILLITNPIVLSQSQNETTTSDSISTKLFNSYITFTESISLLHNVILNYYISTKYEKHIEEFKALGFEFAYGLKRIDLKDVNLPTISDNVFLDIYNYYNFYKTLKNNIAFLAQRKRIKALDEMNRNFDSLYEEYEKKRISEVFDWEAFHKKYRALRLKMEKKSTFAYVIKLANEDPKERRYKIKRDLGIGNIYGMERDRIHFARRKLLARLDRKIENANLLVEGWLLEQYQYYSPTESERELKALVDKLPGLHFSKELFEWFSFSRGNAFKQFIRDVKKGFLDATQEMEEYSTNTPEYRIEQTNITETSNEFINKDKVVKYPSVVFKFFSETDETDIMPVEMFLELLDLVRSNSSYTSKNLDEIRPLIMAPHHLIPMKIWKIQSILTDLMVDAQAMLGLDLDIYAFNELETESLLFFTKLIKVLLPNSNTTINNIFKIPFNERNLINDEDALIYKILNLQKIQPQVKSNLLFLSTRKMKNFFNEYLGDKIVFEKSNLFFYLITKVEDNFPFLDSPLQYVAANVVIKINNGIIYTFKLLGVKGNLTQTTIFTNNSYISFFNISKLTDQIFTKKGLYFIPNYLIKKNLKDNKTVLLRNKTNCYFLKEYKSNRTNQILQDIYIITGSTKPVQINTKLSSYKEMLNPELRTLLQIDFGYNKLEHIPYKTSINAKFTLNLDYRIHLDKSLSTNSKIGLYTYYNHLINQNTHLVFIHLIKPYKDFFTIFGRYLTLKMRNDLFSKFKSNEIWFNQFTLKHLFFEHFAISSYQKYCSKTISYHWRSVIFTSKFMELTAKYLFMYRNKEIKKIGNLYFSLKKYNAVDKVYAAPYQHHNPLTPMTLATNYRYILFSKLKYPDASSSYLPKFLFEDKELRLFKVFANLDIVRRRFKKQLEYYLFLREFRSLNKNLNQLNKKNKKFQVPSFEEFLNNDLPTKYSLKERKAQTNTTLIQTNVNNHKNLVKFYNKLEGVFKPLENKSRTILLTSYEKFLTNIRFVKVILDSCYNQLKKICSLALNFYKSVDYKNIEQDFKLFSNFVYLIIHSYKLLKNKLGLALQHLNFALPHLTRIKDHNYGEFISTVLIHGHKTLFSYFHFHFLSIFTQYLWSFPFKTRFKPLTNTTPREMFTFFKGTFLNLPINISYNHLFETLKVGHKYFFYIPLKHKIAIKSFPFNEYLFKTMNRLYASIRFNTFSNSRGGNVSFDLQNTKFLTKILDVSFLSKQKYKPKFSILIPTWNNLERAFWAGAPIRHETKLILKTRTKPIDFYRSENFELLGEFDLSDTYKLYYELNFLRKNANRFSLEEVEDLNEFFKTIPIKNTYSHKDPNRDFFLQRREEEHTPKYRYLVDADTHEKIKIKVKALKKAYPAASLDVTPFEYRSIHSDGIDWKLFKAYSKMYPNIFKSITQISSNVEEHVESVDQTEQSKVPVIEQNDIKLITTKQKALNTVTKGILAEFYEKINDIIKNEVFSWITFHEYREELLRTQTDQVPLGIASQVLMSSAQGALGAFMIFAADYHRAANKKGAMRFLSWKFFLIFILCAGLSFVLIHFLGIDLLGELIRRCQAFLFEPRVPQVVHNPEPQLNYLTDSCDPNIYKTPQFTQYYGKTNAKGEKKKIVQIVGQFYDVFWSEKPRFKEKVKHPNTIRSHLTLESIKEIFKNFKN